MRTKKAIITSALAVPLLALGGGIAYASTISGSPPPTTRPAVTTTVQTHQPATGQMTTNRNGHRCDGHCDWRGHGYQQPTTQRQATRQQATNPSGYRHDNGNHMGNWGYQGNGQYRSNSQWGCGDCH